MKNALLIGSLVLLSASAQAQLKLGQNPTVIDPAAILQLDSAHLALYHTRVSLLSTTDMTTVPSPKAGMEVYNINPAMAGGTGTGLYYYNGSAWVSENSAATTTGLAWLLLGNAGTVDGVNFLGTTDAQPLNIRIANTKAGRLETSAMGGNTSWGFQTLTANTPMLGTGQGEFNTAVGGFALQVNTTGGRNSAFGYDALGANTTGDSNAAFGFGALQVNTTGFNNTATGAYSLNHNLTGKYNTAVGYEALHMQTADSGNTAVGAYALYNNKGGRVNVGMGLWTLFSNTIGQFNTAIGSGAMIANVTGTANTTLGLASGALNVTGNNNTFIGFGANSQATSPTGLNWSGTIGSLGQVTTNNAFTIGATDAASTPARTQSVFVGINVTDPTQRIDFRNGHLRNRQDVKPIITLNTSASYGITTVALTTGSSDVRGQIICAGANNTNGFTEVNVAFVYTCTNNPIVVVTPANLIAAYYNTYVQSTTTGFTLFFRAPLPGLSPSSPNFNYMIME
jgi:hypothetical protein